MSEKELPARPNLEQYKNQAKDLAANSHAGVSDALARIQRHHPKFHRLPEAELRSVRCSRTDAQLVIAREHGFESWPKMAKHIEQIGLIESVGLLTDPVAAFLEVACVPRHAGHGSGTLEHAEMILARYPEVAKSSVYTAAVLGDESAVRGFVARDGRLATAKGGPLEWDALTYLCFSRYLRLDKARSEAFVNAARVLLEAGASANTGWYETIDQPTPRTIIESAMYGAAGIAQHAGLTRLLLEFGADPNDEETAYHVAEGYDNTVVKILLESGRFNPASLTCLMVRKTDWHDEEGLRLVLAYASANANMKHRYGDTVLQHALRRDNRLGIILLLLDHGADAAARNGRDGRSGFEMAARRGRGDVLDLLEQRGITIELDGVEKVIGECARGRVTEHEPRLVRELIEQGGTLLAEFSGTGNAEGVRRLMELGVRADALYVEGDGYFEIAKNSTALHVAAWRAWPEVVRELIARGAPVNAMDGKARTALMLAVKACVNSYWTDRRSPEGVEALLKAGATVEGIDTPCGYAAVDELLDRASHGV